VRRNAHRDDFVRARSDLIGGELVLAPVVGQESHMIVRAATADTLVHIPRGEGVVERGARVRYLPLG
jgi:molybdopterin biosynthesis enzyme